MKPKRILLFGPMLAAVGTMFAFLDVLGPNRGRWVLAACASRRDRGSRQPPRYSTTTTILPLARFSSIAW